MFTSAKHVTLTRTPVLEVSRFLVSELLAVERITLIRVVGSDDTLVL